MRYHPSEIGGGADAPIGPSVRHIVRLPGGRSFDLLGEDLGLEVTQGVVGAALRLCNREKIPK